MGAFNLMKIGQSVFNLFKQRNFSTIFGKKVRKLNFCASEMQFSCNVHEKCHFFITATWNFVLLLFAISTAKHALS